MGKLLKLWALLALFGTASLALATSSPPLVTSVTGYSNIVSVYCAIETNGHSENCGAPPSYQIDRLDVIDLPLALGKKIEADIALAYADGDYDHFSKTDFFHGHLMARGPGMTYDSPSAYFDDVRGVLFHSHEYDENWWKPIADDEPITASRAPRSFFSWIRPGQANVTPAIDIVDPGQLCNSYSIAGTVYASEIAATWPKIFQQDYQIHGYERDISIRQCHAGEACRSCDVSMMYIQPQSGGRFVAPDGTHYELFILCPYLSSSEMAVAQASAGPKSH